jgi:hypothetical protein
MSGSGCPTTMRCDRDRDPGRRLIALPPAGERAISR